MKTSASYWFSSICVLAALSSPQMSKAQAVELVFATSFDGPEWDQANGTDPDPSTQISRYGDWTAGGQGDQITLAANRDGSTGRGFRHYRKVGTNVNGGGIKLSFPPLTEMWVRLYMRNSPTLAYQNGAPRYTKDMYFNAGGRNFLIFGYQGRAWGLHSSNRSTNIPSASKWANTPSGQWHLYEFHVKQAGGVVEMWVNGVMVLSRTGLNLGTTAWSYCALGSNQNYVVADGYTDYDDIAISTTGYIGPIGTPDLGPAAPKATLHVQPLAGSHYSTVPPLGGRPNVIFAERGYLRQGELFGLGSLINAFRPLVNLLIGPPLQ